MDDKGQRLKTEEVMGLATGSVLRMAVLIIFFVHLQMSVFAQVGQETAPPPLKMLSKSERTALAAKGEPKERTELALELMETRLRSAEKYRTNENYSLMYAELGGFQALMDNALSFLLKSETSEGRRLKSLKKYEIGLREFIPRLEVIRRELPFMFEPYLRNLIKDTDAARERAIQPFFSDTVVSDTT